MRSQYRSQVAPSEPPIWRKLLGRHLGPLVFLLLAFAGMLTIYWYFSPVNGDAEAVAATIDEATGTNLQPRPVSGQPVSQRMQQSPGPLRIGLISGHKGNDSGAVCEDGLTEAQVNAEISAKVAASLIARGIYAEILEEFDARLAGYSATAVISIHADSCDYFNELATGFKISGSSFTDSTALSVCVENAYADATQLPFHADTITPHMTDYHAFREIAPGTPAIIIETGFMNLDRQLLTERVDVPSQGVVDGILCFIDQQR